MAALALAADQAGALEPPIQLAGVVPKNSAEQFELAFWESIKDSNHVSDYEAYLKAYPKGRFVALAQGAHRPPARSARRRRRRGAEAAPAAGAAKAAREPAQAAGHQPEPKAPAPAVLRPRRSRPRARPRKAPAPKSRIARPVRR